MARLVKLEPTKTYKTVDNAIKAVEKKFPAEANDGLRYIVYTDPETGRFYPVFIGEKALQAGIHFHFHVVA